jgi:hypothetical protein
MMGATATRAAEVTRWEGTASLKAFALEAGAWAALALVLVRLRDPLVGLLALLGPQADYFVERNGSELGVWLAGIVTTVAVSRIARVVWRAVGARTTRYRLSSRHLVVESGYFSKTLREVNLRAIDDVLVQRPFLARLVGVGEIAVVASETDRKGPRARVRLTGVIDPLAVHALIRQAVHDAR